MSERALKHFIFAWDAIKSGNFFDEAINNTFEYMIKSLWKTEHQKSCKEDIIKHLSHLYNKAKDERNPPPFIYILISLNDPEINKKLQDLAIGDFIRENASENTTFQLLNFIETFSDKNINIDDFVQKIIRHLNLKMNKDMIEALSYTVSLQHPKFLRNFLEKILSLKDDELLKNFVNMAGRKAFLELTQMVDPDEMNKVLKLFN